MDASQRQVYWEQQGQDKMCAVHTLNSLMQGPMFSEVELAQIANILDSQEQQLMGGPSVPGGMGGVSQNVDADGNFSLPVMETALAQHQIALVNLDRPDVRAGILGGRGAAYQEEAYICNSHARAHWFCMRKVFSKWYDFDSLKAAPTFISDGQLIEFLENTLKQGFTVFVVRPGSGNSSAKVVLPQPDKFLNRNVQSHQMYLTDRDMDRLRDAFIAKQNEEAKDAQRVAGEEGGDGDSGGKPAFTMVVPADQRTVETDWSKLGSGNTLGGGGGGASSSNAGMGTGGAGDLADVDMDDDMRAAILASLSDLKVPEPLPEPDTSSTPASDVIAVQFRFKSDPPCKRLFLKTTGMMGLFRFLEYATLDANKSSGKAVCSINLPTGAALVSMERYSLLKQGFPKKEKFVRCGLTHKIYLDGADVSESTLGERGFGKQEAMILQLE
mmetsp:Transcript_6846/g.16713  ORF Transcript_6846/g.16713 Transcript_6846/m.16713 type:complete len:442 (-) Transcript_6846:272-1597(-)|eukprot:CAMPEP_0178985582 /NCGR_PEP_ID=MMETSP0795-20121207/2231_1 /TAXON_ID=88552 /ORGANISM="Amoebophrya sp., Strain Ameob2" /LENGTH=441 /DNA_ID=CAMNT_0020676553 /DNA_START=225 /DNA_END=1550 /DNA_ORIENTATION=+